MSREELSYTEQASKIENDIARIDQLVSGLKHFETDRPHGTPDNVDVALHMIKQGFSRHPEWITKETVVVIHGSLQYHDPRNLDIDLSWIGQKPLAQLSSTELSFEQEFEGIEGWPGPRRCDTNIVYSSIDVIRSNAPEYTGNPDRDEEWFNFSAFDASLVLSSQLLFDTPEQKQLLSLFQSQVKGIARANPPFCRGIIRELLEVEKIRKERRGELGLSRIPQTNPG